MTNSAQPTWMERSGATPGKLVLIGVLALVLAYVIISQLPSRKSAPVSLTVEPPPASETTATPAKSQTTDVNAVQRAEWPSPDLSQVVAHDPFATPHWAQLDEPEAPRGSNEQASGVADVLTQLQQSGATAIVMLNGERLALVGDTQVRIGDQLKGYRVVAITNSGVVLASEKESP